MNHTTARGTPRSKLSLRYGSIHSQVLGQRMPVADIIPATELRRLVATMVD